MPDRPFVYLTSKPADPELDALMRPLAVPCCVCGHSWPASDPGVCYRSGDHRWWCADEVACRARKRTTIGRMQVALEACWNLLGRITR